MENDWSSIEREVMGSVDLEKYLKSAEWEGHVKMKVSKIDRGLDLADARWSTWEGNKSSYQNISTILSVKQHLFVSVDFYLK